MEHDEWYCEACENHVPGHDPEYCCNGYECGCGGGPQVQCFCSDECADISEREEQRKQKIRREIGLLSRIRTKRLWREVRAAQELAMKSDTLPDTFTQWPLAIKAGLSDINVVKYRMQSDGESGVWMFGDCPNAANHTYHGYTDRQQDGFGGRHISFDLVNGDSVTLKGPFKCEPPKHMNLGYLTRGIVARAVSNHPDLQDYFGPLRVYRDLVYLDRGWEVGEHNRIENMAQSLADEHGCKLAYRSESPGGSISGWASPVESPMEMTE